MKKLPQLIDFKYRSKEEINGWPLIHINLGTDPETGQPRVAAYGIVSIGAVAFGIVTLAGVGLGIVSLAAFAIGIVALGALALGYENALGAAVFSPKVANGVIALDIQSVVWSLLAVGFIALFFWGLHKVKAARLQG